MTLDEQITWYLDGNTYGGVLAERLLAALPLAEGLWCGMVFGFPTSGKPTVEYWERIDDLERAGFAPVSRARARAICDVLPRFLDRLQEPQRAQERRNAP